MAMGDYEVRISLKSAVVFAPRPWPFFRGSDPIIDRKFASATSSFEVQEVSGLLRGIVEHGSFGRHLSAMLDRLAFSCTMMEL